MTAPELKIKTISMPIIPNLEITMPMSKSERGEFHMITAVDPAEFEPEPLAALVADTLKIAREQCIEAHDDDLLPPGDDGWELRLVGERPLYTGGREHPEYPVRKYELHHPRECECVVRGPYDPDCPTCRGKRWT